jgi:hypothetical protein
MGSFLENVQQTVGVMSQSVRSWTSVRFLSQPLQLVTETVRGFTATRMPHQALTLQALAQTTGAFFRTLQQSVGVFTRASGRGVELFIENVVAKLSVSLSGMIKVKRSGSGTFFPMPFLILPQSMMHARMVSESIALHTTISPEAIGRLPIFIIRSVMQTVSIGARASVSFERVASIVIHLLTGTGEVIESPVVKPGWGQNLWGMLFIGFLLGLAIAVYFFKGDEGEEEADLRKPPEEPPEQPLEPISMPVS